MNDRQLECVLTLAEEKSFSEASKRLGISQPSLSQYIQKIEEECGNELFERSLPLKLTFAGEVFVSYAKRVTAARKQMEAILADVSNEEAGKLVIGAGPFNSIEFLPSIIEKYKKKFPKVEIELWEMPEVELEIKAFDGKFDFVISTQHINEKKFDYVPLFEEEIILAIREDHDFCKNHPANKDGIYEADLIDCLKLDFIKMDDSFPIQRNLNEQFVKYSIEPKYVLTCGSILTAYALAREGLGAVFIPSGALERDGYKEMRYYRLNPNPGVRPFGVYYLKGKYISRAMQGFIEQLKLRTRDI